MIGGVEDRDRTHEDRRARRIGAGARTIALVVIAALAVGTVAHAAGRGEPGPIFRARVQVGDAFGDDTADLRLLHRLGVDVDAVFHGWARIYVVTEEIEKLTALGFEVDIVPTLATRDARSPGTASGTTGTSGAGIDMPTSYHDYAGLTAALQDIAANHPDITRLVSLGQTVQGREIWMMKISRNPDVEEDEPGFAYISSMHGDEVVGKELCFFLIEYLTDNDGIDPRVTSLVDDTEIWILPSMNPDGTESGVRYNANFFDLNRNFPDQFDDPVNTPAGRQPETAAVMAWEDANTIALSANFHGGALVANFPYDSNTVGSSVYSPSPDDDAFVSVSRTYADANPPMSTSNGHSSFHDGICNGADWYAINGGMQDWAYVWYGNEQITLEVSQQKWPAASELDQFWDDNRESMLAYMERVHEGIRGVVTDATNGAPLTAEVLVSGSDSAARTDPGVGDYHRVLMPGTYDLEVSAPGYSTRLVRDVVIAAGPATRVDVALDPLATDLEPVDACTDDGVGGCDRWLVPGATADLQVTLRNLGSGATGVAASIEPIGWFGGVTRPSATYPDIASTESGASAAPHHGVDVDAGTPPGHRVGYAVYWSADQGANVEPDLVFLPTGAPTCANESASADVPAPILDRNVTESVVSIAQELEVERVEVTVGVDHTYRSDLRIELVSPAGTAITLHNRSGGSNDDVVGTYGVDLTPFEAFDRLEGESTVGDWTLRVEDNVPSSTGTLQSWSVSLCGRPFEATPPEIRLRQVRTAAGDVELEWWPYPGLTSYRVYRSSDPSSAGAFVDVTAEDGDPTDTRFLDASTGDAYFLVTGVGANGEGPKGHFGE